MSESLDIEESSEEINKPLFLITPKDKQSLKIFFHKYKNSEERRQFFSNILESIKLDKKIESIINSEKDSISTKKRNIKQLYHNAIKTLPTNSKNKFELKTVSNNSNTIFFDGNTIKLEYIKSIEIL